MKEEQRETLPVEEDAGSQRSSPRFVSWVGAVGNRFRSGAELAFAEAKLAFSTFILMMFLSMVAAGAVLFAWALLMFAVAQYPLSKGVSPVGTALIFCGLHVLIAFLLWRVASGLSRNMEFAETRRLLRDAVTEEEKGDDDGVA